MKGFFIMIIDSIKNAGKYYSVHPSFEKAFAALAAIDDSTPNERITVDGDNIFINLSEYTNKNVNDCPFESHKKYIDIQYMVWGEEYIDVCDQDSLEFTDNRLDTDDIAFFKGTDKFSRADLTDGIFVVLFPGEAHRPCVAPDGKGVKVRKAVAKIVY